MAMQGTEIRLECLKLAAARSAQGIDLVISTAKAYEAYVSDDSPQPADDPQKDKRRDRKAGNAATP